MMSRGKSARIITARLRIPALFFIGSFFFLAGLFGSTFLAQDNVPDGTRRIESVDPDSTFNPLPNGKTGEDSITVIPFQVLSWKPRALYFPNFATAEQCSAIINMARRRLTPSSLALRMGDTPDSVTGTRTSSGVFISASEDKTGILDHFETKIAKATMIHKANGEDFNILRYQVGQLYKSHYDAFDPAQYGPQKSHRVASFLLYLSEVARGGETVFPYEDGIKDDYDFEKCVGMKIKPRRGDGLLFYSIFPNGTIDETSLHGSCAVIRGEKWVATKWIRDEEQKAE